MRISVLFLLTAAACGGATADERTWADEGQLCLRVADAASPTTASPTTASPTTASPTTTSPTDTGAPVVTVAVDDVLVVDVTFGGCDCGPELTTAFCTVTREGDTFTVSSEGSTPADGCDPCEPVVASCEVGAIGEGTFAFQHGGDLLTVALPGVLTDPCVGAPTEGTTP